MGITEKEKGSWGQGLVTGPMDKFLGREKPSAETSGATISAALGKGYEQKGWTRRGNEGGTHMDTQGGQDERARTKCGEGGPGSTCPESQPNRARISSEEKGTQRIPGDPNGVAWATSCYWSI